MISYAQNFEDVMLWRALKGVKNGFYVDVGAARPELDSVTKHFYEQGWHGINIEPHPEDFPLLAAARPRDVNLKIAIGPQKGTITFYQNKIRGWSTLDRGTATEMLGLGGDSVEVQVECLPLQEVLDQYSDGPIHFLKIDVEGYEEEVLKSLDLKKSRPWIVVLEAADIHGRLPDPGKSFLQLVKNGYELVYTDALNFFYISQEKSEELKPHFQKPPNIFDGFVHFNSRDQQQHAQYQDLRNLICQEQASGGELKTEIIGLVQNHKKLWDQLAGLKQELIHEINERQDQLQHRNLAEMDALKTSLSDHLRENERNLLEVAKYAEKIQESVVAPSSYLIPAPFSWYSYLYKMLKIKKPKFINKK